MHVAIMPNKRKIAKTVVVVAVVSMTIILILQRFDIWSWLNDNYAAVTAIATVILACITFVYAYSTHKMVEVTKKDRERPQIAESTRYIRNKALPKLNSFLHKEDLCLNLTMLCSNEEELEILSNIGRRSSRLKIDKYEEVVKELSSLEKSLDEQLDSPDFKQHCIQKYNEFVDNTKTIEKEEGFLEKCKRCVKQQLDDIDKQSYQGFFVDFEDKISGFDPIKSKSEDIRKKREEAKKVIQELINEFKKIEDEFKEGYNLATREYVQQLNDNS